MSGKLGSRRERRQNTNPDKELTPKQEHFVQLWFASGNRSESYEIAFERPRGSGLTKADKIVQTKGATLAKTAHVLRRYNELKALATESTMTTVRTLDFMLKNAYQKGEDLGQTATMVSASSGLAKLHGLNQPDQVVSEVKAQVSFESDYMKRMQEELLGKKSDD